MHSGKKSPFGIAQPVLRISWTDDSIVTNINSDDDDSEDAFDLNMRNLIRSHVVIVKDTIFSGICTFHYWASGVPDDNDEDHFGEDDDEKEEEEVDDDDDDDDNGELDAQVFE